MHAERIAQFLPENFRVAIRDRSVLEALLGAMEALHAPDEEIIAQIDHYFDPVRAPVDFLPMLANWMDLGGYLEWSGGRAGAGTPRFGPGMERLRILITRAADLNTRRGTSAALEDFLETATGCAGFSVSESPAGDDGRPVPFHLRVEAPPDAARYGALVARIVEAERPVYATFEIEFAVDPAQEGDSHGQL